MDEHAHRSAGGVLGIEPKQRSQEVRAVRHARGLLVDHFDLVALQYCDIHELLGFVAAAVLDNQQAGRDHLKHKARCREVAGGAPNVILLSVAPNAEVNARALHGGRKPGERLRRKWQPPFEHQGPFHHFGRDEGERDPRHVAFFAAKTGPESRVDDRLNRGGVGRGCCLCARLKRGSGEVSLEMSPNPSRGRPRRRVCGQRHRVAPGCRCAVRDCILYPNLMRNARSVSISRRSSGLSFHSGAAALAFTCSGETAPAMTDATVGWAASQENASSNSEWPRPAAKPISRSTLPAFSSVKTFGPHPVSPRLPLGGGWPRRYRSEERRG